MLPSSPGEPVIQWFTIIFTIVLIVKKNPYTVGSEANMALKLCRISLGFVIWSFSTGMAGFALGIAAFILAIIALTKGRTTYAVTLIVCSIITPMVGMVWNMGPVISALM